MNMRDIGARIQRRREYLNRMCKGYSQEDVAAKLGVTHACYAHFEQGRREILATDLALLGEILHCKVSYFFGQETGPAALINIPEGDVPTVRRDTANQIATKADIEEIKRRLDSLTHQAPPPRPVEDLPREQRSGTDVPHEVQMICAMQSKVYCGLSPGTARTRYIESLYAQAEAALAILEQRLDEEEDEQDGSSVLSVGTPVVTSLA